MTVAEFYATIGGNYQEALGRLMNDDFIKRFVTKFSSDTHMESLQNAYALQDFKGVFEAAHGLKGVAGNLAFTPLFVAASGICEKTRNLPDGESVDLSSDIAQLKSIYDKTVSSIGLLD